MMAAVLAHQELVGRREFWTAWDPEPAVVGVFVLGSLVYGLAVGRLWSRAGRGRGVRVRHVLGFAAGMAVVLVSLASPLDALATTLVSAHMGQHLLLASLAAPLLAYGSPLALFPGALPAAVRRTAHRWRRRFARRLRRFAAPLVLVGLVLHTATFWVWHVPVLYEASARSDALHALQHASFLGTGVVFWWAILGTGRRTTPSGIRIVSLFAATLQGAALGALMTFSGSVWYPAYEAGQRIWGIAPMADQQLAGMLMWGVGAIVPVAAAALIIVAWLERAMTSSGTPRRTTTVRPGADGWV